MAKMTPLEKDAMEKQVAAERKKGVSFGASDRVLKAGHEALSEMRRETRGKAPEVEQREKAYKDPYTIVESMKKGGKVSASSRADGCCVKGKTKGRMI
jgi:hypothetical protein